MAICAVASPAPKCMLEKSVSPPRRIVAVQHSAAMPAPLAMLPSLLTVIPLTSATLFLSMQPTAPPKPLLVEATWVQLTVALLISSAAGIADVPSHPTMPPAKYGLLTSENLVVTPSTFRRLRGLVSSVEFAAPLTKPIRPPKAALLASSPNVLLNEPSLNDTETLGSSSASTPKTEPAPSTAPFTCAAPASVTPLPVSIWLLPVNSTD